MPAPTQPAASVPRGPNSAEQEASMTNTDTPTTATQTVRIDIRHLTVEQLAGLGVSQIAYVKPVLMNGTLAFAIHAADGTPMAMADDRDLAVAAIRQHEMLPTLVH
jgi:hypothetical protein